MFISGLCSLWGGLVAQGYSCGLVPYQPECLIGLIAFSAKTHQSVFTQRLAQKPTVEGLNVLLEKPG